MPFRQPNVLCPCGVVLYNIAGAAKSLTKMSNILCPPKSRLHRFCTASVSTNFYANQNAKLHCLSVVTEGA